MKIETIQTDLTNWDTYVENHPQGTIYHKSGWKNIIESHFGKKTHYLLARDDQAVRGVLPLVEFSSPLFGSFIISVPYVNYGGLLFSNDQAREALLKEADRIRDDRKAESVELRHVGADLNGLPVKTQKVTFFLDLPGDSEELLAAFKAKLRSQIRRPMKEGMYAKSGGQELLDDYYAVFSINMRDLGTPVYDRRFFSAIFEHTPENCHIVTVYTPDHKCVGAAFLIGYRWRMEIPWASTLKEYNRYSPNMLLYWEVLKLAIEKGYKQFDFGRCSKEGGTYRFKKQWGATEIPLHWYYLLPEGVEMPQINPDNPKYRLAISAWQKLPVAVANAIGPHIVKHLP